MEHSETSLMNKLNTRFEAISSREKSLLFYGVPLLIIVIAILQVLEPALIYQQKVADKIDNDRDRLAATEQSLKDVSAKLGVDLNLDLKTQIEASKARISDLTTSFDKEFDQLVQPNFMPILLEQMIDQARGIELVSFSSIPPEIIYQSELEEAELAIYQHGIKLTFEGDFFATRAFLEETEGLGWKLYWNAFEYNVTEYPTAEVSIEIFTLSTKEEFIIVL